MEMGGLVTMSHPVSRIICIYPDHSISTNWYEEIVFQRWSVYRDVP